MSRIAALIIIALLTGCSITYTVKPVQPGRIANLCIQPNPAVALEDFLPVMEKQIQSCDIKTVRAEPPWKPECRHHLEYTANIAWDLVMYMNYAELQVYEEGSLIGEGIYNARRGGGRLDKFGHAENKLKPLVEALFCGKPAPK